MADHVAPPTGLTAREPAMVVGVLTSFAAAVIGVLVAFGAELTDAQQDAILTAIPATVGFIILAAYLIRRLVYPQAKVVASVQPDGTVLAGPASPLPTGAQVDAVEHDNPMDGPARMDLDL